MLISLIYWGYSSGDYKKGAAEGLLEADGDEESYDDHGYVDEEALPSMTAS